MRTLTLLAAQASGKLDPLVRLVLTGASTATYNRTRILKISGPEEPFSQTAEVYLDDNDKVLTSLDYKGYSGVVSWGLKTSAGEEYSAAAPLKVTEHEHESYLDKDGKGRLACKLTLKGIFDLLADDHANADYIPDDTNTDTVKTLINAICGATLACFNHCTAYTVTWDSEDSLIDVYTPKSGFRIYTGGTRLAALRRLLDYTGCVARVEADGYLHILVPTTSVTQGWTSPTGASGTSWVNPSYAHDGNEETIAGYVIPAISWSNYLTLTWPSRIVNQIKFLWYDLPSGKVDQYDLDVYYGGAWHDVFEGAISASPVTVSCPHKLITQARIRFHSSLTSGNVALYFPELYYYWDYDYTYNLPSGHIFFSKAYRQKLVIPNREVVKSMADDSPQYSGEATDATSYALLPKSDYHKMVLSGNAQGTAIAQALIVKDQMHSKAGVADVPMNVGAEVYDYVRVIDGREGQTREGCLGYVHRYYNVEKNEWHMTFGFGEYATRLKTLEDLKNLSTYGNYDYERLLVKNLVVENINLDTQIIEDALYSRVSVGQLNAHKLLLSDACVYNAGYNPATKRRNFTATPTTPYDLNDTWMDGTTFKRCTTARASGAYVEGDWVAMTLDEIANGVYFRRTKSSSLTADGLVILDQVYLDDVSGTYGLLYKNQISAHKILLSAECAFDTGYDPTGKEVQVHRGTSAPADTTLLWMDTNTYTLKRYTGTVWAALTGEWYRKTGVALDSTKGIALYGGQIALKTYPTEADYLADTNVQCYVGADGKIYAGAGAVVLDATALKLQGVAAWLYDGTTPFALKGKLGYAAGAVTLSGETAVPITLSAGGQINISPGSPAFVYVGGYILFPITYGFGPDYDTAAYTFFRTLNKAGDTSIDHVFAPMITSRGRLGDGNQRWKSAHIDDVTIGGDARVYGSSGHMVLAAPTSKYIYLYPAGAYILPWEDSVYNLGASNVKFLNGYFDNLPACPVPTSNSALEVIKKIKAPKVKVDGKYGERHYFLDDDFPDEMKTDSKIMGEDKVVRTGGKEIEFIRTIGVLVQAVRELTEKVEVLEAR